MQKLLIAGLACALAAPGALLAQPHQPPPEQPPPAPPPAEARPEKKADGPVETLGGAVGGVLGSAAGAAGGPVGSAAAGLVGKSVGRNTASFVKRLFSGKKNKEEPQALQAAATPAPWAEHNAVAAAATAPEPPLLVLPRAEHSAADAAAPQPLAETAPLMIEAPATPQAATEATPGVAIMNP